MLRILITAGATSVAIDAARKITNLAKGSTGHSIAIEAAKRGHQVVLATNNPHLLPDHNNIKTEFFDSYQNLHDLIKNKILTTNFDAIIMTAAVSDYGCVGIYEFPDQNPLSETGNEKVGGSYPELWLKLKPLPKLIDLIRSAWEYRGILVKFKLEANKSEKDLLQLAEQSRLQSQADLMVANRIEDFTLCAWLGPIQSRYENILRPELAPKLIEAIENLGGKK